MSSATSRTENLAKNIVWGYVANIATMLLRFISRTIFIYTLGSDYLGFNGLFTNILGILSFTELGIGGVLNYSLYKPLATGDTEKIKSLMALYKKAYRIIMLVVLVVGIAIMPLLPYMIKGAENVEHVYLYYGFFLFNTVTSYMVSYKSGLMNAAQKEYVITGINAATNVVVVLVQCIALLIFHNYLVYLFIQSIFQLLQNIVISICVDKQFPLLGEKNIQKLPKEEKRVLAENVEAMICHKIGDVCVHQTDNIIVSSFVSLIAVGKISNYTLITTSLNSIVAIVINNCVASLGNFISVESKERRKEIFKVYNFLAFWIYGIVTIELFVLLQPFVEVWAGKKNLIDDFTIRLIVLEFYFTGLRVAVANFKAACGIFKADKYIGIVQAIVNLILSIVLAKLIGLPGVYIGTMAQGAVDWIWRPRLVYQMEFKESSREYYVIWFRYLLLLLSMIFLFNMVASKILVKISLLRIIVVGIIIGVFVNLIFYMIFYKTKEFLFLKNKVKYLLEKIWRKNKCI